MKIQRRDLHFIVLILLVPGLLLLAGLGLVTATWDMGRYRPLAWLVYGCALLGLVYFILGWPAFVEWMRERVFRRAPAEPYPFDEEADRDTAVVASRRGFVYRALSAGVFGGVIGAALGYTARAGQEGATDIRRGEDPGAQFHRATAIGPGDLADETIESAGQWWKERPHPWREDMESRAEVALSREFQIEPGMSLEEAINRRRSRREFTGEPLTEVQISGLLHYAAGETDRRDAWGIDNMILRAIPSYNGLYPVEVYVAVHDVEDVSPGIYYYDIRNHALRAVRSGDVRNDVAAACASQGFCASAGAVFVLTGNLQRAAWRSNERGYRHILLEAGHIAQNLYLTATAMGLGACAVSVFYDEVLNGLLDLGSGGETEEMAVYAVAVGRVVD